MSVKPSFPHNEDSICSPASNCLVRTRAENPSQALVEQLLETNHVQELVTTPPYHLESNQVEVQFNGQILSVDEEGVAQLQEIGDFDAVIHVGLNENAEKPVLRCVQSMRVISESLTTRVE